MSRLIGVYKELRDSEDVLAETPDFVTIEGASNVFGTDSFDAKLFLTNQRILFLIAKIMDWKKMNKEAKGFWETLIVGQPKKDSTAMVTTWMDLPLESVKKVETPSGFMGGKGSQLIIEFDIVNKSGFLGIFRKNPKVVVHLDNRDMWRTQIEFHRRKLVGNKVQEEETEEDANEEERETVTKKVKKSVGTKKGKKGKFCSNCGAKVTKTAKFCGKCGETI